MKQTPIADFQLPITQALSYRRTPQKLHRCIVIANRVPQQAQWPGERRSVRWIIHHPVKAARYADADQTPTSNRSDVLAVVGGVGPGPMSASNFRLMSHTQVA